MLSSQTVYVLKPLQLGGQTIAAKPFGIALWNARRPRLAGARDLAVETKASGQGRAAKK